MKSRYQMWALGSAALIFALFSTGCYTQFGTVQDEEEVVRYEDEDEYAYDDSVVTEEEYDGARERFYEESYYPGYAYSWGFADPWFWHHRWGYAYDPFGYDPFWGGWCGTGYPYYSAWWSRPVYGYMPSAYYGGGYHGGYAWQPGRERGSSRTIGSTRSDGGVRGSSYNPGERGTSGGTSLNVGAYRSKSGVSGSSTKSTTSRPARVSAPSGSRSTSREGTRVGTERSSSRPSSSGRASRPSSSGKSSSGSSSDHGSRSGGSYSPPASSAPAPASTPSSSGGSQAPANTGERGGNRR